MTDQKNGNGKWQVGFWVMATICVGGLLALSSHVVANDQLSRARDEKISNCVSAHYADLVQRLARIETLLEHYDNQ